LEQLWFGLERAPAQRLGVTQPSIPVHAEQPGGLKSDFGAHHDWSELSQRIEEARHQRQDGSLRYISHCDRSRGEGEDVAGRMPLQPEYHGSPMIAKNEDLAASGGLEENR
jgi:hypothetical protein